MPRLAVLLAVAGALLAGCAAPAQPDDPSASAPASSAPSAAPSPSAAATVAASAVATVHLETETMTLLDAEGAVLDTFAYVDPGDAAREALVAAFGSEPEATPYAGGAETPGGVGYVWPGVRLADNDDGAPGSTSVAFPDWALTVEVAELGGVAIETVGGIRVGATQEQLDAVPGAQAQVFDGRTFTWLDLVPVAGNIPDAAALVLVIGDEESAVRLISVPSRNFGA